MNKYKIIIKSLVLGACLALGITAQAAWTPVPPATYALTNATYFCQTNGALIVSNTVTTNILSQPYPVWRGRGYALNVGAWSTNGWAGTVSYLTRSGTPFKIPNATNSAGFTMLTNWDANVITNTITLNGAVEVFNWFLIPASTVDNVGLVQLLSINPGTSGSTNIWLDPTNTFISVIP